MDAFHRLPPFFLPLWLATSHLLTFPAIRWGGCVALCDIVETGGDGGIFGSPGVCRAKGAWWSVAVCNRFVFGVIYVMVFVSLGIGRCWRRCPYPMVRRMSRNATLFCKIFCAPADGPEKWYGRLILEGWSFLDFWCHNCCIYIVNESREEGRDHGELKNI